MAIATGDPRYREKDDLDREHGELTGRKARHVGNQQSLRFEIADANMRIAEYDEQVRRQDALAATLDDVSGPAFSMEIQGRAYSKRTEAGARLREVLLGLPGHRDRPETHHAVARIAGLTLHAVVSLSHMTVTVHSPEAGRDFASVGVNLLEPPSELGLVASIEYRVKAVAAAGNATRQRIAAQHERIAMAEPEVGKPFPEQQRLDDVTRRREQLISELQIADAAETPPAEDDHSPEAVALRQRIAARHDAWLATRAKARDGAAALGVRGTRGESFAYWYVAITQGLLSEHQPPVDAALHVWQSIGSPRADQKPRLAPLGATGPDLDELDDLTVADTDLATVPDLAEDASETAEIPGPAAENDLPAAANRVRTDTNRNSATGEPAQTGDSGPDTKPPAAAPPTGQRTGGARRTRSTPGGGTEPPQAAAEAPRPGRPPGPELPAAAAETGEAAPDTAAEIAEAAGIPGPASAWLRRYLLAISLQDDMRDTQRANPDDLGQAVARAIDDGLAARTGNHTAAARWRLPEPDPSLVSRYANDPGFAAKLRDIAHGWIQRRITRDLTADLPDLIATLVGDLDLPRDDDAVAWMRHWISDAATDPQIRAWALANSESHAGIPIAERLVDIAVEQVEDVGHPAVAYVVDSDQYARDRLLDLARHWIYDQVRQRGRHAPAESPVPHRPQLSPAPDTRQEETDRQEAAMAASNIATPEAPLPSGPPGSLRAVRALAETHRLHVTVERADGQPWITVHEVDATGAGLPPLLTLRPGDTAFASPLGFAIAVKELDGYLGEYRSVVSPVFDRLDPENAGRLALVAPAAADPSGTDRELRRFIAEAIGFADRKTDTETAFFARRLYEAETAIGDLRPAAPRAARFLRAATEYASAYAWAGDPVAHLAERGHLDGITRREREWLQARVAEQPETLDRPLPDHRRLQAQAARERAEQARAGEAGSQLAHAAYAEGRYADALDRLDDAELADPGHRALWDHLRNGVLRTADPARSSAPAEGQAQQDAAAQPVLPSEADLLALHARINADTAAYFDQSFDESEIAQRYVSERLGGDDKTVRIRLSAANPRGLQIGYAPAGWQGLRRHLRSLGYRDDDLVAAGVVKRNDDTGQVYDCFRDRITFAVRDEEGRVCGFTARALSDDVEPKYLNTKTTPLFRKGELLLGLHEQTADAAGEARDRVRAVVVQEGPFDVAATRAADTERELIVVGSNGTAVTLAHFDAIDRVAPASARRVIALDGDEAGRSKGIATAESVIGRYPAEHPQDELAVTVLPGGMDGAEWALSDLSALPEDQRPRSHTAAYLTAPTTQSALAVAVQARIDRFADTLQFVDGCVNAAKHVAALLATVDPARAADHAVLVQQNLRVDVEYMAEHIAQIRQSKGGPLPTLTSGAVHPYVAEQYAASRRDADTPNAATPANAAEPAPPPDTTRPAPGRLARKLTVEITGRTVVLSGTDGSEPQAFREALKKEVRLWFRPREGNVWKKSARTKAEAEDLARRVHEVIARFDAAETARRAPKPTFPPTPQQQAIIDAALSGRDVAVLALAGTGKTSTMRMLADRMTDRKIIYFAFNRSIADEAQGVFASHVDADTMHAFARRGLQNDPRLKDKLSRTSKNDGYPGPVARALGIDPDGETAIGGTRAENLSLVRAALRAVKQYRESSDTQITGRHLGHGDARELTAVEAEVLRLAKVIWADKMSPGGQLQFTHDDYLKAWALTGPVLDADLIIFDEAQDVNELQAHLVQAQSAQTIVVGDSHQSIYGFRGAKDFLRDWPADITLPLTKSWRFGPAVAETGNHFLAALGANLRLEGNDALDSRIEQVRDPDAVLCRTNAGAVAAVLEGFEAGKRVALVGEGTDIKSIAEAAQSLMRGRRTNHPDLKDFRNWKAVRQYVDDNEDARALRTFVRLVGKYNPDGLIAMAEDLADEHATAEDLRPDLVVSTAHQAKGREWDAVQVADDFRQPERDPGTGEIILPSGEDLRLAYVTVTRAKARLGLGSLAWIREYAQGRQNDAAATETATPAVPATAPGQDGVPAETRAAPPESAAPEQEPALVLGDDGLTVMPDASRAAVRQVLESQGWQIESVGEPVEGERASCGRAASGARR
ncbi:AAA family ATPase [Amycolatopsis sp. WGS_07]|uniref:AAA family ATPase n=1 Tax=Amycolatopsis sp. WGS_07 TaxID=3076764 RepID=UPI003872E5CB